MARTRRDILRERRDRQEERQKKEFSNSTGNVIKTPIGFIKGGIMGAGLGFLVGVATNQRLFFTVTGFLAGGSLAENLKRIKETKEQPHFANYSKQKQ